MLIRSRRPSERGQVLVLALAFLALFALLSVSVLSLASTVQKQRGETESTAALNAATEGSAQFAIADQGVQGCGTVTAGHLQFPADSLAGESGTGDTLSFPAPGGSAASCASATTTTTSPGQNCVLCVLNYASDQFAISDGPATWVAIGEIDVNGQVSPTSLASGTKIGLHNGAASCTGICSPANTATDGAVTTGSKTATSAALFTGSANYQGLTITDSDGFLPPNTTITHEVNATNTATLSAASTGTAAGDTFSIIMNSANDGTLSNNSNVAGSVTLFANDTNVVGDSISDNAGKIPANTTVIAEDLVHNTITMSQNATHAETGDTFYFWSVLSSAVQDPLAGDLPIPVGGTPGTKVGTNTYCPGTYTNLNFTANLSAWGTPGCAGTGPSLFVVTGSFGGNATIVGNNVTVYLAPTATVDFSGTLLLDCGANVSSSGCPAPPTPQVPASGPYKGIAIFADPAFAGIMEYHGNGALAVDGTIEASHATLDDKGGGTCTTCSFAGGRVIVSEITGSGSGNGGHGFTTLVDGGPTVTQGTSCGYFSVPVMGALGVGSSQDGRVLFESVCGGTRGTGIISFAYGDGP